MGSGSSLEQTQTEVKCNYCGEIIRPACAWRQGRCPHRESMLDQILADPYRSRFYNLFKFFTGRK